jgi:DNA-binding IscR family transcriptional regulator
MELMARESDTVFTAKTLAERLNASEAHLAKVFKGLLRLILLSLTEVPMEVLSSKKIHRI